MNGPKGNGFVAAFVAGVVFGYVAGGQCEGAADFTEDEGQFLALLTFLYFGALLLGPRLDHLTSILFALLVVEEVGVAGGDLIVDVMSWTVGVSVVAHGLSAVPLAERYGDWFESMEDAASMPEAAPVAEMRNRL